MKRGRIKILFDYGEHYVIDISVPNDQDLQEHAKWKQIKAWRQFGSNEACLVSWDDGSELLLVRDKILSISMTPEAEPLEITT